MWGRISYPIQVLLNKRGAPRLGNVSFDEKDSIASYDEDNAKRQGEATATVCKLAKSFAREKEIITLVKRRYLERTVQQKSNLQRELLRAEAHAVGLRERLEQENGAIEEIALNPNTFLTSI